MGRTKWTPQHQATAEVAAACGVSLAEIARTLGVGGSAVRNHLLPGEAEANRERARRWSQANPEARREAARRWQRANPEARRERSRRWREANPEANREKARRWDKANPEARRELAKRWNQANPERMRAAARRRAAWKRAGRVAALAPLTLEAQRQRFALFGDCCAYCGSGGPLEVEHVQPLSRGGLDEPGNVAPACRPCNRSKHAQAVEDWYKAQPFFTEARWRRLVRHCPTAAGQLTLSA